MRGLRLTGSVNFRDLGGTAVGNGRRVKAGVLLRSETPEVMTDQDAERVLERFDLTRVIDLRGPRGASSGLLGKEDRRLVVDYFDITKGSLSEHGVFLSAEGFLVDQIDRAPEVILRVLEALTESKGATLIHCHTGKDRTGFVVAVILAVLGADDEEIVADYMKSATIFATMMENLTAVGLGVPESAPDYARNAPSEVGIRAMLNRLRSEWPDPATYLTENGVDPRLIAAARSKLIATN